LTDDDAVPRPDWLVQLRTVAASKPAFSIFGGVVLPRWESDPEPWITSWVPLNVAYALTDPTWPEGPITPLRVYEPNSAYRAHIFSTGYKFDPTIGPLGSNYPMGSGSELHLRLMNAGFMAWHCKHAVVEHIIRKTQMDKSWVLGRAFRYGRGEYRQKFKDTLQSPRLIFGVPAFILRDFVRQALRVARTALTGNKGKLFRERWDLSFQTGLAYEARMIYRPAGAPKYIGERT
jgi:GT2 family glycosyltransferase